MSFQSKKVIIIGAGFTTRNMGVWALASGGINSVWHACPNAEIYFLDYHSTPASFQVRHPAGVGTVRLINIRFSKNLWLPNNVARLLVTAVLIRLFPSKLFQNKLYSRNFWLKHIQAADFIGSIAGGDSFSDIYGVERLIYVALPQLLTILLGKPLVLLPQTIGPFESSFGKVIASYILRRAFKVYSRDNDSIEMVRKVLEDDFEKVEFSYDLGFALESIIQEKRIPDWLAARDSDKLLVGLNISGLLYMGGYTQKNMFGLACDYRRLVRDLIEYFVRMHNVQVMLIPHVLGGEENQESDVAANLRVFNDIKDEIKKHVHVIGDGYDHHELKALIGRCDFFLGSRMHGCIAALSQCIPTVGLAYSRKFRGVFSSISMDDLVIDLCHHNEHSVLASVEKIYHRIPEIRLNLKEKIPNVIAQVLGLLGYLRNSGSKT